ADCNGRRDSHSSSDSSGSQSIYCCATLGGLSAATQSSTNSSSRSPTRSNVIFERSRPDPKNFSLFSLRNPCKIASHKGSRFSPSSSSSLSSISSKLAERALLIFLKCFAPTSGKNFQSPYAQRRLAGVEVVPYLGSTLAR